MKSDNDWLGYIFFGFALGMMFSMVLLKFGALKGIDPNLRSEAIELGYAELIVGADGSTEFKWKEVKK